MVRSYWELSDDERRRLSPEAVGQDEVFVLWKINHGRRLTEVERELPWDWELTDLRPERDDPPGDEAFYDAIASLLFAGAHAGHDARRLCAAALDQYEGFVNEARAQASELRDG